jgi:hypothetical protein
MGIWDPTEVASKRLRNASNYIRRKCVPSSYAFGRTLPRDIALGRIFAGVYRGVSQAFHVNVFTLDRLSLPEKRILNLYMAYS